MIANSAVEAWAFDGETMRTVMIDELATMIRIALQHQHRGPSGAVSLSVVSCRRPWASVTDRLPLRPGLVERVLPPALRSTRRMSDPTVDCQTQALGETERAGADTEIWWEGDVLHASTRTRTGHGISARLRTLASGGQDGG
jgi:head-tail adaptor